MIQLNKEQQDAVTAGDGPALVLAGAGSGKTRVIIERLAWLVEEHGVDPRHLLALTFTNKAAGEIRNRFTERLQTDRVAAWLGTFHSFGLYILRFEMERLERKKSFTIFDDGDQLGLMKRLVKALPTGHAAVSPREALTWISRLKQQCETPSTKPDSDVDETMTRLWGAYHDALRAASAVDFDDLLTLLVQLFDQHPDVLQKYQRRYRYILIDEYQDTNRAQYRIARHLSAQSGNIFAVGDEDQSIYGWRGADIRNILDFVGDFPEANVYRLEENYRSTRPILDAANAVVAHNTQRLGKNLRTSRETGEPVRFFAADDGEGEARFVARDIAERGINPGATAVLFRTNAQARQMEEALRNKGLHYIVVGGIQFYARKEIKDLIAYLRLLTNPDDDDALLRIVNLPARGIGGTTLQQIQDYAQQRAMPLLQVMREVEDDLSLSPRARTSIAQFVSMVDDLARDVSRTHFAPLIEKLLDSINYRDFIAQSDEKDFRSRLDNVDEFVVSCQQYDQREGRGLMAFLQDLALASAVDTWDSSMPAVALMTCHNAKGLEFDHVYLIGLEEGLLPLLHGSEDGDPDADVEEERRLCYVAMTRARDTLTLTAAQSRMLYGRWDNFRTVSRFVGEIGVERLHRIQTPKEARQSRAQAAGGAPGARKAPLSPSAAPSAAPVGGAYRTGAKVRHARFGRGVVMFTEGSGERLRVQVRFDTGRSMKLMVAAAPLELLEEKKK